MSIRTWIPFVLATLLVVSGDATAQSKHQLRSARKLLRRVELVDGTGSGLDADTLRGMTPEQLGGDKLDQLLNQVSALSAAVGNLGTVGPRRASDIVTVTGASFLANCLPQVAGGAKFDTLAKGDGSETPFTIPSGKVLVVTSARILGFSGPASSNVQTRLFAVGNGQAAIFAVREAVTDGTGRVNILYDIPTGAVVASGAFVCVNDSAGMTLSGELHGFLAPDE